MRWERPTYTGTHLTSIHLKDILPIVLKEITKWYNLRNSMNITYYKKNESPNKLIATFGIYITQWNMSINNLAVISGNSGNWFITMPNYKDKDSQEWVKTVAFDKDTQTKFMDATKEVLTQYAKDKGITIV